ncbi:hypothetical protein [Microbacterium sp. KR10-403]|uniref:hypothetical protein n=1 Tax=Microbacterium sp. KR10-403 TaxID=3158581 RepID=UPI0032E41419
MFAADSVPTDPDQHPRLSEERLTADEAARVAAYLEAGTVVMHTTARGIDVLDENRRVVPLTIRTDGDYVWTGPVAYYVKAYGVAPDAEFLAHLRARDFRMRVPTDDEVREAAEMFAPHE